MVPILLLHFKLIYLISKFSKFQDQIIYLDYGGKIPSLNQFDIYFIYNADATRTALVTLKNANGAVYATGSASILAGTNKNVAVTLNRATAAPIGIGYTVTIQFFNTNNAQTTIYSKSVNVTAGAQGFYATSGKVYDANQNEFIMRGMSNAHGIFIFFGIKQTFLKII